MWSTAGRDEILGLLDSGYAGLIKALTSFRTPSVTEADYTGYGTRPALSLGAAADMTPAVGRQRANDAAVTFPKNTGPSQDVIAWGWYAADTGGSPKVVSLIDADAPILGTADESSEAIRAPGHGLSDDQRVYVLGVPGGVIPAGLSEGTAYYVVNSDADNFELSLTQGGAAVNITAKGAAMFIPYTPVTIATNATPQFGIGTLLVQV